MVPRDLLSFRCEGDQVLPCYFLERDQPWLQALLDEYVRYEGRPRRELHDRLRDPLPLFAPRDKLRIARHVLDRLWRFQLRAAVPPRQARAVLFGAAAQAADGAGQRVASIGGAAAAADAPGVAPGLAGERPAASAAPGARGTREQAIAAACAELAVEPDELLGGLFADLPFEKRVVAPERPPGVAELAQRANLALVGGLLKRAAAVSVTAGSNLRALVRQAKLTGLLCTVRQRPTRGSSERIEISGPFALFRRTLVYGRALASLVPFAVRCQDAELRATCLLDGTGQAHTLVVRAGDPIFPAPTARRHDSRLEARFFRDFTNQAPDWDLVREPAAVPVDDTLIFPDFELRHRRDPERCWLLEIVGFWTPQYLQDKLRRLRQARLPRFILCIDADRNCSSADLPPLARVVAFKRRIDPAAVLRIVEGEAGRWA